MSRTDYRGTTVPDVDDDLLAGLIAAFASAGVVTQAASVAAARLAVDNAIAAGATVSNARPMTFDVGSILYRHDGTSLRPYNEVEAVEQTVAGDAAPLTVGSGAHRVLIASSLPARPYDRQVQCWGVAYGSVTGYVDLDIRIRSGDDVLARYTVGGTASQSVTNYGIIPAGVAPAITLGVRGGVPGGGTIQIASDARLNRLVVTATPIRMAG